MLTDKDNDLDKRNKEKISALNSYAKYSALGLQMFAVIGAFTYAGYKIDENRKAETPLATAFFSLAGVFIALYLVIRSIKKLKS